MDFNTQLDDLKQRVEHVKTSAAAAANAVDVCPEGNDCRSDVLKPPPNLKSRGLLSLETKGRARPSVPLRNPVVRLATSSASVPCQAKSVRSGRRATRPIR